MTYLYNTSNPSGQLFDDKDVAEKLKQGWVDTPDKLSNEPKRRKAKDDSKADN